MSNEYELKFLNVDKEKMRALLSGQGYRLTKPETLMRRQTYHLPKDHPEFESKWGRVRDEGDRITATVKWYDDPSNPSVSDVHEEEVTVTDWESGVSWIQAKGFTPTACQENTREAWQKPDHPGSEVTIDTWPGLNPYVEVEAPSEEAVFIMAKSLGFDPDAGIAGGTEIVYQIEVGIPARTIKSLSNITFDSPPRNTAT